MTKPHGLWLVLAFVTYFGLSGAIGAFIYGDTLEGIVSDMGRALGTLLIPAIIALVVARRKNGPVRLDIALLCSAIIHVYAQREPLIAAFDVHQFKSELRGVPAESVPATILASQTNIGRNIAGAIRLMDAYNRLVQSVDSEIDDPAFAELIEPRRLADPNWRAAIIPILDQKREAAAGFMARVDAQAAEARAKIMSMATPGMTDRERAQFFGGVAEGMRNTRPAIAAYVAHVERYLTACSEMIRFLSTPEGTPTLNAQGRLNFRTQEARDAFIVVAGRVDNARSALIQSAQNLSEHEERSLQGLQRLSR